MIAMFSTTDKTKTGEPLLPMTHLFHLKYDEMMKTIIFQSAQHHLQAKVAVFAQANIRAAI